MELVTTDPYPREYKVISTVRSKYISSACGTTIPNKFKFFMGDFFASCSSVVFRAMIILLSIFLAPAKMSFLIGRILFCSTVEMTPTVLSKRVSPSSILEPAGILISATPRL